MSEKETVFTPEQQATINKTWINGNHPKQCKGNCQIFGIEIAQCASCGWDDGYVPVASEPYLK